MPIYNCSCRFAQSAERRIRVECNKKGLDFDSLPARYEFSFSNRKLKKDNIASFNQIAGATCHFMGACGGPCYAKQGPQSFPTSIALRASMFLASREADFVPRMAGLINGLALPRVRHGDSGDFYCQHYLQAWLEIARNCPRTKFYAYTKCIQWIHELSAEEIPANLRFIQSEGGLQDHMITDRFAVARIFPDLAALKAAKFTDTSESDLPALQGKKKIGLIIHGCHSKKWLAEYRQNNKQQAKA